MRILVIEDEKKVAHFIKKGLEEQAYAVDVAYNGIDGESLAKQNAYDLIILDILLPKQSGWETCQRLRARNMDVPILMLTALGETEDKVKRLDTGADDYLTKPFDFDELLARVRALLRRGQREKAGILQIADLTLNPAAHQVERAGKAIRLTAKEFALLEYFMRNKGRVLMRTSISEHVWDIDFDRESFAASTRL